MKQKIIKNTLFLSGSQIFGRAIGFFYFIFLARSLSVENLGIYSWVLGFGYNFYPLADFGIERIVLKHLPREPKNTNHYLSRLLPLRLVLAVLFALASVFLALVIGAGTVKVYYLAIFSLALLPYNLVQLYSAVENAKENSKTYAKATALGPIIFSLLGVLVIKTGLGLGWLFLVYTIANLLVLLDIYRKLPKLNLSKNWQVDVPFWKKILSESWIFAFIIALAVFYIRIPLIMTGLLLDDYWTGIYGSASKFIEAGILIPQSLSLALFPLSSKLLLSNKPKLKSIYCRSVAILFGLSIPVGLVMFFGGKLIIPIIYGSQYANAISVFSLMGVLMIFFFVNSLPGDIIHNSDKIKKFLPLSIANFLVAALFCLLLIPRMGVIGGVWAMIIGEIFGVIVNNLFVFRILNDKN